jgi:hypothetical protein
MNTTLLDPATEHAAQVFLERIAGHYNVVGAILFGSRARHTQRADSDADLPGFSFRPCRYGKTNSITRSHSAIHN